jgi:hypothetical protein
MSEAYGALKVACICDVNDGQNRVGLVVGAQSTVVGTFLYGLGARVRYPFADTTELLETMVRFSISPVNVFEMPVLQTVFYEYDLTVSFDYCGI